MANPLLDVQKYGQSIWYDNLRRGLITSGELAQMVERDGLLGVTSNPAIFEKAITGSTDYDQAIKALVAQGIETSQDIYERLAVQDIQLAADLLYPVYIRTRGRDGYVSLEVSPYLANDTKETLEEARRLYGDVRRDNVMIKVPATPAGIPAIQQLISEGICVNVTLLFDVDVYQQVAEAYMAGLETYGSKGGDVSKVASVASFFVSRVDSLVDARLEAKLDTLTDGELRKKLKSLVGQVAIANARLAYARYRELIAGPRWRKLADQQAMPQRLLWASTGTKNPKYSRTRYVEELIGPDTVNTVPTETYLAFKESGRVRPSLTENWAENLEYAQEMVETLQEVGLPLREITQTLLAEGITKFTEPFDRLLAAIESKRQAKLGGILETPTFVLGKYQPAIDRTLEQWRVEGKVRRLWQGDATLWTGTDEGSWLAWLHTPEVQLDQAEMLQQLNEEGNGSTYQHIVVLGMGGSALCPELFARVFGTSSPGRPELLVLDTIDPAAVQTLASRLDPARTLFVVSSKSGGTVETSALFHYFFERVRQVVGFHKAGSHFIAITDPKTRLHVRAKAERFRGIYFAWHESPGRFSALSNLGLVPAALLGVEVEQLLQRAQIMAHSCASCVPPELNPGVRLGVTLGTLAEEGRDKVTLVLGPALTALGPWLEQLISESTGKDGRGLIVVEGERLGSPEIYREDRVFVQLKLADEATPDQDAALLLLERAGHPLIRLQLPDKLNLGQEIYRWQMATATAAAVLGVNPFNMPDVEAAKVAARAQIEALESGRPWVKEHPLLEDQGWSVFADANLGTGFPTAAAALQAHLDRLRPGDYFAIDAFLGDHPGTREPLSTLRHLVRDRRKVATLLGYAPRLLHSMGQLHKGGPNSGLFLVLTADPIKDAPVPGQKYTLGDLQRAQANSEFGVLTERGRRVLHLHLGHQAEAGLQRLVELATYML